MDETLDQLKAQIREETSFESENCYNIISLILIQIQAQFGREETNKVIDELGLGDYGFSKLEDFVDIS